MSFFFFKQKTAYEILRSDWSSDVCSSDLGLSVAGLEQPGMAKVDQRVEAGIGFQPDAAAVAAVAAVGTAFGDVFFAAETGAAVPAAAGTDFNFRFVDEFHGANSR